jgi:seryl-tRNA(Sec) selenium transferase
VIVEETFLQGEALPSHQLPTVCLAISPASQTVEQLAAALRRGRPAVLVRQKDNVVLLDLRSVAPRYDLLLVEAIQALAGAAAVSPAGNPGE